MAEVDFVMLRDDFRFIKPKHAHKNRNRTISAVKSPCLQSSSRRPTADRGAGELWARDWFPLCFLRPPFWIKLSGGLPLYTSSQTPASRFPFPVSRSPFPAPRSPLPVPRSPFPVPDISNIRWCYNYRSRSTTKIKVFASVRNSLRTSLWTRRRKTNADSRFLMNKIIRSILTLQIANIGIDIISASFKFSNECEFFNFLKAFVTSRVPPDAVQEFRMISRMTNH